MIKGKKTIAFISIVLLLGLIYSANKEIGTFRLYYDFEDIQNSMVTVVIKWDNFEERMKLTK